MDKKYVFSIKHKSKCLFSRRNGFKGFLVGDYSVLIKLWGIEL